MLSLTMPALVLSLFSAQPPQEAGPPPSRFPVPAEVMAEISSGSCGSDIESLVSFGTRHTLSDTTSKKRGIGAARNWIADQMKQADAGRGILEVRLEEFDVPPTQRLRNGAHLANVVGVLKGTKYPDRRYYVVGHYDSRNSDGNDAVGDAPGANDNASGTVVVLQIARALAATPLESTVVFLYTAGEEQGLIGAKYHADQAKTRGEKILAVLNNDIVGDPEGNLNHEGGNPIGFNLDEVLNRAGQQVRTAPGPGVVRVFSEGIPRSMTAEKYAEVRSLAAENDSPSRQLARYVADVARRESTFIQPKLIFRNDRFLRGGDHSSFLDNGFPAVRFTAPHEEYSRQHQDVKTETLSDGTTKHFGDTAEFVDYRYLRDVARLNAATIIYLANAPSTPANVRVITAELTNSTTLRWTASPERETTGYEIVWRDTTAADWQESKAVGNVTEITLPLSKDDLFFGVRAIDTEGYRSPVGFAAAAPM